MPIHEPNIDKKDELDYNNIQYLEKDGYIFYTEKEPFITYENQDLEWLIYTRKAKFLGELICHTLHK